MTQQKEEIKHYGIPGMKWGVRKAREFGRARRDHFKRSVKQKYGVDLDNPRRPSSDHTVSRGLKKKKLKELSNEELKTLTTRLQLERNYKDLTKRQTSAGERFVGDVLKESGKQIATKYVRSFGETAITSLAGAISESLKN